MREESIRGSPERPELRECAFLDVSDEVAVHDDAPAGVVEADEEVEVARNRPGAVARGIRNAPTLHGNRGERAAGIEQGVDLRARDRSPPHRRRERSLPGDRRPGPLDPLGARGLAGEDDAHELERASVRAAVLDVLEGNRVAPPRPRRIFTDSIADRHRPGKRRGYQSLRWAVAVLGARARRPWSRRRCSRGSPARDTRPRRPAGAPA